MKKMLLLSTFLLCAAVAQAGQVDLITYYDNPDGNFRNLDVTGAASLGTDNGTTVTFGTGGGAVTMGTNVSGTPRPLTVRGNVGNAVTATFMGNNQAGVITGGPQGATYGVISGRNGGAEAPLYLNAVSGGRVGVGSTGYTTASPYQLMIAGQGNVAEPGNLGISTAAGAPGEVVVDYVGGGGATDGYYATYAP